VTVSGAAGGPATNVLTPAVSNGVVFVTTTNGYLYAFGYGRGKPLWNVNLHPHSGGRDVVSVTGTTVLVLTPVEIVAVNSKSHSIQWRYAQGYTSGNCRAAMATDGHLVFEAGLGSGPYDANPSGEALSLATGKPKWSFATAGYCAGFPAVANGVLYSTDSAGNLYVFDSSTGKRLARLTVAADAWPAAPAITGGAIYEANEKFALPK